jgi:predicted metal-dependent phosphoesterase TrpH
MGTADLHIHSTHSWDGTCTVAGILKQASQTAGLNVIAVTDHDSMAGAYEALELSAKYPIEVIPGMEVTSREGHFLCLFIEDPIPSGLSMLETVLHTADQGGICIVAHPTERGPNLVDENSLSQVLKNPVAATTLVGLEAFNACLNNPGFNHSAYSMALKHQLALVGNSDAHVAWMIGRGATSFPGTTAAELRNALIHRQTGVIDSHKSHPALYAPSWWVRYSLRRLGWVSHNQNPQKPLVTVQEQHIK